MRRFKLDNLNLRLKRIVISDLDEVTHNICMRIIGACIAISVTAWSLSFLLMVMKEVIL